MSRHYKQDGTCQPTFFWSSTCRKTNTSRPATPGHWSCSTLLNRSNWHGNGCSPEGTQHGTMAHTCLAITHVRMYTTWTKLLKAIPLGMSLAFTCFGLKFRFLSASNARLAGVALKKVREGCTRVESGLACRSGFKIYTLDEFGTVSSGWIIGRPRASPIRIIFAMCPAITFG